MASTLPTIRGKLGSTEYYVVTMKGKELVERLTIPKDLDDWADLSVEERYQRDINLNRVKNDIAPYMATDPDRFFGALIVAIMNPEQIQFESLGEVAKGLPGLYKVSASGMGFLNLSGGEILVPLDGQHRLKAVKFAITGKDDAGDDLPDITPSTSLAQEDVTVLLVPYQKEKARKIFNKVNRYAKPTSKAQNLITDDDDVAAVITRQIADKLIGARMVNFQSNALNKQAKEFTTLSTLYESVEKILAAKGHKYEKGVRPDKKKAALFEDEVELVWNTLLEGVEHFFAALADRDETGDDRRRELRDTFVIGKPIGQLSLVLGFLRLQSSHSPNGAVLSDKEICSRLNRIDWNVGNALWQRVLMNGDKVAAGRTVASFAGDFISYIAGERLSDDDSAALLKRYRSLFPIDEQAEVELPAQQTD
jgi:DNA sulfur modification protein DndB